jgi:hypothetical protein
VTDQNRGDDRPARIRDIEEPDRIVSPTVSSARPSGLNSALVIACASFVDESRLGSSGRATFQRLAAPERSGSR